MSVSVVRRGVIAVGAWSGCESGCELVGWKDVLEIARGRMELQTEGWDGV